MHGCNSFYASRATPGTFRLQLSVMSHLQHIKGLNHTLQIGESMLDWLMVWSHTHRLTQLTTHMASENTSCTQIRFSGTGQELVLLPAFVAAFPSPGALCPPCPPLPLKGGPRQLRVGVFEQGSLEESLEAAGGVSSNIVEAFRSVLQDSSLDGAFVSAAITLPASTELRDDIPNLNPLLLYQVRCSPGSCSFSCLGCGLATLLVWTCKHDAWDPSPSPA